MQGDVLGVEGPAHKRDGDLEIVVGAMDQRLYAWDGDGTLLDGYPIELCTRCDEVGARILSSRKVL